MRKIEEMMLNSIRNGKSFNLGNTSVVFRDNNDFFVTLHGNVIFVKNEKGTVFSLCGWNTPTTKSRLRALGVGVKSKNGSVLYNNEIIDTHKYHNV